MEKTLSDYFLNPIYLLYFCGACDDFKNDGVFFGWQFPVNFVIAVIISFFGCVYNEIIILFFCGLERDTHDQISIRSTAMDTEQEVTDDGNSIEVERKPSRELTTLEILEKRNHEDAVRRAKRAGVSTEGSTIEILERINHEQEDSYACISAMANYNAGSEPKG